MSNRKHSGPQPPKEFPEFDNKPLPQRAIQLTQRFVEHQQPRPRRKGPGKSHPLLLPTGQRGNSSPRSPRQPHQLQQLPHTRVLLSPGHAMHTQPEPNVPTDIPLREQLMVLEHQPDPPLVRGHPGKIPSVEQHPPRVQGLKPGNRPQQRRLTTAARPEHAHDLVLGNIEADAIQHGPCPEPNGRSFKTEHGHGQNSPVRSVRSRSSTNRATAHTTIKIVERAIAWP